MPQTQEIGQAGPGFFSQINNMQEIPQVYDPQAIQREALQAPRIDPIMTIANVFGAPAGIDPGRVFGSILKDVLFQHVFSSIIDKVKDTSTDDFPSPPKGYQEGYYPPSKYAPRGSIVPFKGTEELSGEATPVTQPFDPGENPIETLSSYKEGLPDYVRFGTEYKDFRGKEFLDRLSPYGEEGPPDPRGLVWHALGLDPNDINTYYGHQIQNEGLKAGWFSETPHGTFGKIRLGARPEDLPPLTPGLRNIRQDPIVELIPKWSHIPSEEGDPLSLAEGGTIEPSTTVSGHDVGISIHPSKFTVIDSEGNLLGKLAEQRAGERATTSLSKQLFKQLLEEVE